MILLTILDSGGLRLDDTESGEAYEVAADTDSQRLGRLIRRLAVSRYASGYEDGLTTGWKQATAEQELRERRGPARRAKLALN